MNVYLEKIAEMEKSAGEDNFLKRHYRKRYDKMSPEKEAKLGAAITGAGAAAVGGASYKVGKDLAKAKANHKLDVRTVRTINAAKKRAEYNYGKKGMDARQASNEAISTIHRRQAKAATKSIRKTGLKAGAVGAAMMGGLGALTTTAGYGISKALQSYGESGRPKGEKKGSK